MGRFRARLASERGFTLVELLVVIVILAILAAIAVPAYLTFRSSARTAAAKANVRTAIAAAEAWYQDAGNNSAAPSYSGLSRASLLLEAPGISPNVKAAANGTGDGYCIEDSEDGGASWWSYAGGAGGAAAIVQSACGGGYLAPV